MLLLFTVLALASCLHHINVGDLGMAVLSGLAAVLFAAAYLAKEE